MGEAKRRDAIPGIPIYQQPFPLPLTDTRDKQQYGGNIVKAHVGRWSEDCPEHQGVVVLGMDDMPLVSHSPPPSPLHQHLEIEEVVTSDESVRDSA